MRWSDMEERFHDYEEIVEVLQDKQSTAEDLLEVLYVLSDEVKEAYGDLDSAKVRVYLYRIDIFFTDTDI